MRCSSACLTDPGFVRTVNQDACLDLPSVGLWAVADGVGGHNEGEYASQLIVKALSQSGGHTCLSEFVNDVEDKLMDVNKQLIKRAAEEQNGIIGSTVAALLAYGRHIVCLWAGDSRIYRYRNGKLVQITQDHSEVEELIQRGDLHPDEANDHPLANMITRAVGADPELYLDAELQELHNADRYLICSDGLYKELSQAEIAEHIRHGDCLSVCQSMVAAALERGAQDNVTVVAIKFDKYSDD